MQQDARAQEAEHGAGTRHAGPDPHCLVALRLREGGSQQRQRRGHDERRTRTGDRPRDDDLHGAVEEHGATEASAKIANPTSNAPRRPYLSPMAPAGSSRHASTSVYPSTIQVSWPWVAVVSTAISGSAALRATIEVITSNTSTPATINNQMRPRLDRLAMPASIF